MLLKGGDEYGLLSFHTYTSLIPATVKDIYIIGEPLHYCPPGSSTCCAEVCFNVTRAITDFLAPRYPNTTILVRRGFAFDGFAQLALAKTVVCSPSSFCFFAGIANPHGGANYASTPLILNGETPDLGVGLKWIDNRFVYGFWRQEYYKVRIGPSLLLSLKSLFLSHSAPSLPRPAKPPTHSGQRARRRGFHRKQADQCLCSRGQEGHLQAQKILESPINFCFCAIIAKSDPLQRPRA